MKQNLFVLATAALLLPLGAQAGEEHRELGAHVHGHGKLDMAVDGTKIGLDLEIPGMDIVGFEHAASTPEQTAAVEKAKALLAEPLKLFVVPQAAQCKVASADVKIEAEHHHDDGDDDHDDHDKAGGHDDHDEAGGEHAGHTEFHAAYTLSCAAPEALTSISFAFFSNFPGSKALTVNVVTGKGQNGFEVAREKPDLSLSGIM